MKFPRISNLLIPPLYNFYDRVGIINMHIISDVSQQQQSQNLFKMLKATGDGALNERDEGYGGRWLSCCQGDKVESEEFGFADERIQTRPVTGCSNKLGYEYT